MLMKKILIGLILFALYLHFFPDSAISKGVKEHYQASINWVEELSSMQLRMSPEKVMESIKKRLPELKGEEKRYMDELLASPDKVKPFYQRYCYSDSFHPKLREQQLKHSCDAIRRYLDKLP